MKKEVLINKYKERKELLGLKFSNLTHYEIENLVEHSMCTNIMVDFDSLVSWIESVKEEFNTEISEIPLHLLDNWNIDENKIIHKSGKFFEIMGLKTSSDAGREVSSGWGQPIIKEYNFDGGVLGLLRTYIEGLPHYLIQTKFEPGNYGPIQISPTLQATFSNLNQEHGGRKPHYHEFFNDFRENKDYIFNSWLAEDGGRFYKKRNRGLVKQVRYEDTYLVDKNFNWASLFQIKKLMKEDAIINPHLARLIFL